MYAINMFCLKAGMKNPPTEDELAQIPRLGLTKGNDVRFKEVYDIYRFGSTKDWYVIGYSADSKTFYGYP